MSDLLTSLSTAARALDAQRYGLDVTGQNIANVNTPGYSRRSIELAEVPPLDSTNPGGGVDVIGVKAARTPLLDARLWREQPAASRESAVADQLTVAQVALGKAGESLDASLAAFYNAFGSLALDPQSLSARQQTVAQGQALAHAFNSIAAQLSATGHSANAEILRDVDQINTLAARIAALNVAIGNGASRDTNSLRDEQANALNSLSELIDIAVIPRTEGGVDVTIGNGEALVAGENAYALTTASTPPLGYATISSQCVDMTSTITGGRLGGLLQVRDVRLPGYLDQLDRLAYAVATDVNAVHASGTDLDGNAGGLFFNAPGAVAGAAAALSVNSALVSNARLVVAAAAGGGAADNTAARQIAALQDRPVGGGTGTATELWADLVYRVGSDIASAARDRSSHQDIVTQLQTLRDQISGVSIDEEAAMMLRFQRAYEANARFFSAADQSLDVLMRLVGG